jgi:hypothetical protein
LRLSVPLLSAPASMMQLEPPPHVAVQSAPQLVLHDDCAAHGPECTDVRTLAFGRPDGLIIIVIIVISDARST